ncbi:hypothetical protein LSTR_LSTR000570 [Laodelphax striatellus]|uniref:Uncharacterized protein n=1 Tax=Laodelphax striatellus TaxID=195883 RepID=A0A482XH17_LAOST|nr:hypothetical protein LSTR_LSTR000570 [Laodelphax striatellus]
MLPILGCFRKEGSDSDSDLFDDSDNDPDFQLSDHHTDSEMSEVDNDDDAVLNDDVEQQEDIPNEPEEQTTTNYWYGRGRSKFKWSKKEPQRTTRTPIENIIPRMHIPGV